MWRPDPGVRHAIVGVVVLGLLTAALTSGAPAQPRPPDKITLRLDWVNTGNHAVWYYARDKGIFADQGLDIEILEGRGSDLTAQTVGNGSVMFGTADTATVVSLASQGLPVKMVGIWFKTSPIAFIYPKKTGWKTMKDMAGARVGIGALLAPVTAAINAAGLEGKLQIVRMEPATVPISLLEGRVDLIISYGFQQIPPLEAKGLPVSMFPISEAGINVPGLALITNHDVLKKTPDIVKRFVAAAQKALDAAQKDPSGAIDSLLKRSPALDRAVALRVLELSFRHFTSESGKGKPLGWIPPPDIEQTQEILLKYGGVKTRHPIETYFTNEFVPGA